MPSDIDWNNSFTHIIAISNELIISLFFTPNNDTINDFWKVLEIFTGVEIAVFNIFCELLVNLDVNRGLNRRYNSSEMLANDYWCLLSATSIQNETSIKIGYFSLLKKNNY